MVEWCASVRGFWLEGMGGDDEGLQLLWGRRWWV